MGRYLNPSNVLFETALNMFDEFSMTNPKQLAEYAGFTESEVKELCRWYEIDFEEKKRWYDGLKDTVMELLAGTHQKIDISAFSNDMTTFSSADDVLTLLIHLGYLGYDYSTGEVFISNSEIASVFVTAIKNVGWQEIINAVRKSESLLKDTWNKNAEAVAKGIEMGQVLRGSN